ncbi:3',5'-cyclic-AMP phosphodiesterase [Methylomonas sp. LL1]|uniref:3',5'-cyclic-AMP phosphodiesterase n=1 Tax=Methylomonas sp. LL1 TaxID=2785785 RepID=UPI0018C3F11B|nr:3',5'-cyclic-AMP phosphodiesterase [Methylomonas sp. LL1]QPK65375.1 3',5'-cyclic-AMP phosphodiesterase [Methylomonas sp. LL1]
MLKVLQITDMHLLPHSGDIMLGIDTEHYFKLTLEHAHAVHGRFDLILLTGDLAQDPCPGSYQRLYRHLNGYDTPCLCLPGNHDDLSLMTKYLNNGLVSCQKHLVLGNWLIIGLNSQKPNSPVGALSREELVFLQRTLQSNSDRPTLIAVHHHCFASGSAWLDTMQIQNSEAFLKLIEGFGQVKAVTCGHIHQEFACQEKPIAFFATPASCFQFTPNSSEFSIDETAPGYRIFNLYDDGGLQSDCHRLPVKLDNLNRNAHEY